MDIEKLEIDFDGFVSAIIEQLKIPAGHQGFTQNSNRLDGLSVEGLLDLIRDAIYVHVNEPFAHNLRYDQIGALSRQTIIGIMGSVQIAGVIPISSVQLKTFTGYQVDWVASKLSMDGFVFLFNGKHALSIPLDNLDIPVNKTSVIFLNIDTTVNGNNVISLDTQVFPDMFKIPIGLINSTNQTISFMDTVKIGKYKLSKHALGASIPVSNNKTHQTGTLDAGWK